MSQGQEGKWDCNAFLIQFYPTALEKGTAATQKKKKKTRLFNIFTAAMFKK